MRIWAVLRSPAAHSKDESQQEGRAGHTPKNCDGSQARGIAKLRAIKYAKDCGQAHGRSGAIGRWEGGLVCVRGADCLWLQHPWWGAGSTISGSFLVGTKNGFRQCCFDESLAPSLPHPPIHHPNLSPTVLFGCLNWLYPVVVVFEASPHPHAPPSPLLRDLLTPLAHQIFPIPSSWLGL